MITLTKRRKQHVLKTISNGGRTITRTHILHSLRSGRVLIRKVSSSSIATVEDLTNSYSTCKVLFILMDGAISYGFCFVGNQYDSLSIRIWRSIEKEDKQKERLAKAMVVTEEDYHENYEELSQLTKIIQFKGTRLNEGKRKTIYRI